LVDALGNPVGFCLTGGQEHDLVGADELLPTMQADMLIADKAYDADERVLEPLAVAGKTGDTAEGQSKDKSTLRPRVL
jgi:transposase